MVVDEWLGREEYTLNNGRTSGLILRWGKSIIVLGDYVDK
jgi:hypothetical protein